RWQDFAGTGDLLRTLQSRRRGGGAGHPRKRRISTRAQALKAAVASGLAALITSIGDRAAQEAVARWHDIPAGAALLEQAPAQERIRAMKRRSAASGRAPFDDDDSPLADSAVPPPAGPSIWDPLTPPGSEAGQGTATEAAAAEPTAEPPAGDPAAPAGAAPTGPTAGEPPGQSGTEPSGAMLLSRSAPDLPRRAAQAISSWQDHVMHLVQAENVTKRSIARVVSFDDESLALVMIIGLLGFGAGDSSAATQGTSAVAQELLSSLFGPGPLREIGAKALADLKERVGLLFEEEMLRFAEFIDADGVPDETAAVQLYQATYSLEVVR
ncbi:MAG: hypothetical protein ACRDNF_10265, partial [Streptosporangiaceae bacterium]